MITRCGAVVLAFVLVAYIALMPSLLDFLFDHFIR